MKWFCTWMCIALMGFASVAAATEVKEGATLVPGTGVKVTIIGGSDGSVARQAMFDPNGILRVTEEYPYQLQTDVFVAASFSTPVSVTTGLKQIGNSWTAFPYGDRTVRILRTTAAGSGNVPTIRCYLYGSDDNVNFYPLAKASAWGNGTFSDTLNADTLTLIIPSGIATQNTYDMKYTIPSSDMYPGRYIAVYARRDSTTNSLAQTLGIQFEGRYK